MYINNLSENEIITGIKVIKKGTQIGYGPATEFMNEDSFIIYLNNNNHRISPHTIPVDEIDNVRDMIETSHKNEIEFYNRQNSMKSVFNGDIELKDYLNFKIKSAQGNDFISDLDTKYQNFTDSVNNIYEQKKKRELDISDEIDNSLSNINNTFFEGKEELLNELKIDLQKHILSPNNSENNKYNLYDIPEHLRDEYKKIFDNISDEVKQSLADKSTLKKDNRYKPSIHNR